MDLNTRWSVLRQLKGFAWVFFTTIHENVFSERFRVSNACVSASLGWLSLVPLLARAIDRWFMLKSKKGRLLLFRHVKRKSKATKPWVYVCVLRNKSHKMTTQRVNYPPSSRPCLNAPTALQISRALLGNANFRQEPVWSISERRDRQPGWLATCSL